ncbi:hypothetical protein CK203_001973 [Vitis vinifera]|uniref:Uncharacterized protein n=1 Tax=Vitis vinifera TaxID=29760 RepID=A0A438KJ40_VITVI|nr:hypothetical protein CK203_001973 [Vitis vinifera]
MFAFVRTSTLKKLHFTVGVTTFLESAVGVTPNEESFSVEMHQPPREPLPFGKIEVNLLASVGTTMQKRKGAFGGIVVFWDSRVLELVGMEVGVCSTSCQFKNCDDGAFWWQPEANCSNEKILRENRRASTERSSLDRGSFYMEEGGPSPFRFENMWLKEEGFKEWNTEVFGNVVVKKLEALSQMEFWDSKEALGTLSFEEESA